MKPDWFQLELDLHQFLRKIKLRVFFDSKNPMDIVPLHSSTGSTFCLKDLNLMLKSDFSPMVQASAIDTFINLVKQDVNMLKTSDTCVSFKYPNMTKEEIQALNELSDNHNITIKPADKGGGVVVLKTSTTVNG